MRFKSLERFREAADKKEQKIATASKAVAFFRKSVKGENHLNIIESYSEASTRELGLTLGKEAGPGSIFALIGDLGTGKTILAKGMAEGLEIQSDIVSPTFTIVQEYHEGRLPFYHFDIYRIEDEDELFEIGFDEYINGNGVCLVEWADQVPEAMPEETVWIRISKDLSKGVEYRKIEIGQEVPEGV